MTIAIDNRRNWLLIIKSSVSSIVMNLKSKSHSKDVANQTAVRLLDTYGNGILRLSYSYVHNLSDAEEILQDTIVKYLTKSPQFESDEHEKAWLFKVASNLSKNKLRYNSIRSTDELNDSLISNQQEDLSYIWEAVKSLPENYREVIHLYYQEGYNTVDIAKILNKKETSIRSDLHRARQKLKEILKEMYDFE